MKALFKNNKLHEEYERNGCVVINLFSKEMVSELKQFYFAEFGDQARGLYTTHSHSSGEKNVQLHNKLGSMIRSDLEKVFRDFEFVVNHYVVKSNVNSEEFRLHQDWNIVDEDTTQAAHIWCPLQDTSEKNGGMFVVKGSHRFFDNLRSGSMGLRFINRTPLVKKHLTVFNMQAGEALVYKQALFHGSFPNNSDSSRVVMLSSIREKTGEWLYYQKRSNDKGDGMVDAYAMDTKTFLHQLPAYEKGSDPAGIPIASSFANSRLSTFSINDELFEKQLSKKEIFA